MNAKQSSFKTCYISAPLGEEITSITHALDHLNVKWDWANSRSPSQSLPGDLRSIISRVDFVLGVLKGADSDRNTLFEIGMAIGLGRPVFLVVPPTALTSENLPAVTILRADLNEQSAIQLHLELFLMRSDQVRKLLQPEARNLKARRSPKFSGSADVKIKLSAGSTLENEVARIIMTSGGIVRQPPHRTADTKYTPDLLFWQNTDETGLLNPAVVEVKSSLVDRAAVDALSNNLASYLRESGLSVALIITRSTHPLTVAGTIHLNIFMLGLDEFKAHLLNGTLGPALIQTRNRAAHGSR
jgi:hypothetical protein